MELLEQAAHVCSGPCGVFMGTAFSVCAFGENRRFYRTESSSPRAWFVSPFLQVLDSFRHCTRTGHVVSIGLRMVTVRALLGLRWLSVCRYPTVMNLHFSSRGGSSTYPVCLCGDSLGFSVWTILSSAHRGESYVSSSPRVMLARRRGGGRAAPSRCSPVGARYRPPLRVGQQEPSPLSP